MGAKELSAAQQELFDAVRKGDLEKVNLWLANKRNKRPRTPLNFLRASSTPQTAWLSAMVDPSNGYTALHLAALQGHTSVLSALLDADVTMLHARDRRGCLPIHLAAWNGHLEVVQLLLETQPELVDAVNNAKESPLHLSAQHGHAKVVTALLAKHADARLRNARAETALDIAARLGKANVCRLIICNCPELALQSAADCSSTDSGRSRHIAQVVYPLHAAARHGHIDCLQILCQSGFDLDYVTDEGSALHVAALFGKVDAVKLLLSQGISIETRDSQGRTVLDTLREHESEKASDLTQVIQSREGWSECRKLIESYIQQQDHHHHLCSASSAIFGAVEDRRKCTHRGMAAVCSNSTASRTINSNKQQQQQQASSSTNDSDCWNGSSGSNSRLLDSVVVLNAEEPPDEQRRRRCYCLCCYHNSGGGGDRNATSASQVTGTMTVANGTTETDTKSLLSRECSSSAADAAAARCGGGASTSNPTTTTTATAAAGTTASALIATSCSCCSCNTTPSSPCSWMHDRSTNNISSTMAINPSLRRAPHQTVTAPAARMYQNASMISGGQSQRSRIMSTCPKCSSDLVQAADAENVQVQDVVWRPIPECAASARLHHEAAAAALNRGKAASQQHREEQLNVLLTCCSSPTSRHSHHHRHTCGAAAAAAAAASSSSPSPQSLSHHHSESSHVRSTFASASSENEPTAAAAAYPRHYHPCSRRTSEIDYSDCNLLQQQQQQQQNSSGTLIYHPPSLLADVITLTNAEHDNNGDGDESFAMVLHHHHHDDDNDNETNDATSSWSSSYHIRRDLQPLQYDSQLDGVSTLSLSTTLIDPSSEADASSSGGQPSPSIGRHETLSDHHSGQDVCAFNAAETSTYVSGLGSLGAAAAIQSAAAAAASATATQQAPRFPLTSPTNKSRHAKSNRSAAAAGSLVIGTLASANNATQQQQQQQHLQPRMGMTSVACGAASSGGGLMMLKQPSQGPGPGSLAAAAATTLTVTGRCASCASCVVVPRRMSSKSAAMAPNGPTLSYCTYQAPPVGSSAAAAQYLCNNNNNLPSAAEPRIGAHLAAKASTMITGCYDNVPSMTCAKPSSSAASYQMVLRYDNVPTNLLVYDNAPPFGHRRWEHTCGATTTAAHHQNCTTNHVGSPMHSSKKNLLPMDDTTTMPQVKVVRAAAVGSAAAAQVSSSNSVMSSNASGNLTHPLGIGSRNENGSHTSSPPNTPIKTFKTETLTTVHANETVPATMLTSEGNEEAIEGEQEARRRQLKLSIEREVGEIEESESELKADDDSCGAVGTFLDRFVSSSTLERRSSLPEAATIGSVLSSSSREGSGVEHKGGQHNGTAAAAAAASSARAVAVGHGRAPLALPEEMCGSTSTSIMSSSAAASPERCVSASTTTDELRSGWRRSGTATIESDENNSVTTTTTTRTTTTSDHPLSRSTTAAATADAQSTSSTQASTVCVLQGADSAAGEGCTTESRSIDATLGEVGSIWSNHDESLSSAEEGGIEGGTGEQGVGDEEEEGLSLLEDGLSEGDYQEGQLGDYCSGADKESDKSGDNVVEQHNADMIRETPAAAATAAASRPTTNSRRQRRLKQQQKVANELSDENCVNGERLHDQSESAKRNGNIIDSNNMAASAHNMMMMDSLPSPETTKSRIHEFLCSHEELKKRLSLSPTSISSKAQQTLTDTVDPLSPSSTDCSDCTLASSCSLPIISQLSSTPPSTIGISPTRFERSEVSKQYSNEDPSICSIEVRLRAPTATLSKQQQANAVAAAYHVKEAQAQAEALAEAHRGMVMDGGVGSSGGSGSDDCNLMMIGSRDNSHCYNHLNTNTNTNANALYEAKLKQQQYAVKNGSILSSLDESIEWREINDIMESFGGGICRESVFTDQYEPRVAVYLRDRRSKALTLQLNNGTATAAAASSPPVNGNTHCACYSRTTATDGDGDGVATATDGIDSKHFLALATAAAQTGDGHSDGDGSAEPVAVPSASRRVSRQYAAAAAAVAPPNAHVQLLGTQTAAAAAALQLESHSSSSRSLPSDGCVHGTCSCAAAAAADDHLLSSSLVSLSPRHHTTTNRCYRCGHDHQQHFYSNNNTVAETAATTNASEEMILISSLTAASKRSSPTITTTTTATTTTTTTTATTTNDGVGAVQPQPLVSTLNSSNARLTIIKSSTITASNNNNNNNNNKSNINPHKSINNASLLLSSSYPSGTVTSSAIALQPKPASYRSCCDSTHRYHHNTHAHAHVQAANTASAACVHQTNVVVAAAANANANASSLNCTSCCMRPLAESIKTIAVPLVASVSTSAAAAGGGYHKNNYNGNHQVTTSASSNRRQSSKYHHHHHYSPNRSRSSSSTTTTTTTTSAVANWLNVSVGVPNPRAKEIATVLESHGFDSVKHMQSTLDRAAMHEIGLDKSTQHQIGTYLDNYPGQTPLSANSFTYVSDWLNSLELEDYLGHFITGGLTSMLIVLALDPSAKHLKSLGITLLGHQKRILESLKEAKLERRLRVAERINAETAAVAAELEAEGTDSGQESRSTAPSSSCRSASRHKSQMLMPYAQHRKGHHQQPHSSSSIIIGGQPTEWRHSSSTLIEECVSYSAHYLGSMEISNIEGTEDSRRAMIKLKKGIREIAKVPQVLLEISVAGVRVLDATTKQLTVEHDITRIQIVCQDERDLNCFAYISQDGDKHFCHVFCVLTADVATEIIITLGQAFEVCYRLANGTYRSDGADPIVINPLL